MKDELSKLIDLTNEFVLLTVICPISKPYYPMLLKVELWTDIFSSDELDVLELVILPMSIAFLLMD